MNHYIHSGCGCLWCAPPSRESLCNSSLRIKINMSIISRIINMYMNENVLINYVKNEHLTKKTISMGRDWDSSIGRGAVG